MVRATRSTVALQNQQAAEPPHPSTKKQNKKRKRASTAPEPDEQRSTKYARTEQKKEEEPGTGDLPLNPQDAAKILDVLEMIDTQGLLDRVFPLPETDSASSSKASSSKEIIKTYSLRTLLKDSAAHPLRVLRSAIQPLFPISSHPRSRPSVPAAQQRHFCNLAISLLDQSSKNQPALPLSQSTLFPDSEPDFTAAGTSDTRRRYALVQKLPTGEWWSSSNTAREGEHGLTAAEAKEMRKGQAELVSIIPALPLPASSLPTLGELQMEGRKEPRNRFKPLHMTPRTLSAGTFLDYGPYTSFAPAFDSEGAEVGRDGLGQMLMGRLGRRKVREARRKAIARLRADQTEEAQMKDSPEVETVPEPQDRAQIDDLLLSLLPDQKTDGFKAVLDDLRLEEGVTSLLEKNACALERLNLLQITRLRQGNSHVREDSEEWRIAQEIMNSLALLASLRPRSTSSLDSDTTHSSLIPPPSVIRALHATLPAGPSEGWQGTLDEARKTALRDDTTVHVRAGAVQASTASSSQYRPTTTYSYQAPTSSAPPRPTPQTPAQTYYPNAYLQSGANTTSAAYQYQGQYGYPPATWFGYQQPGQKGGAAAMQYYGNYLPQAASSAAVATTTPRVVGNTAKPQQGQNGWAQGYGQNQSSQNQAAATLPPHLRRTGAATPTQAYAPYHAYVPPTQTQGR